MSRPLTIDRSISQNLGQGKRLEGTGLRPDLHKPMLSNP